MMSRYAPADAPTSVTETKNAEFIASVVIVTEQEEVPAPKESKKRSSRGKVKK